TAQPLGRARGRDTGERVAGRVECHERDDRQARNGAHLRDRRLELVERRERLEEDDVDAAPFEQACALAVLAARSDRARDEDLLARHLARLARKLYARRVDRLELVLEKMLRKLRAARAERVRLDQLRARADVAELHV